MDDPESQDFQHEMSELEALLDALPATERKVVTERLRDAMIGNGVQLNAADEEMLDQFSEGAQDIRQVQQHFGDRMWRAFGARPDSDAAT
jgi:hypothetical protein